MQETAPTPPKVPAPPDLVVIQTTAGVPQTREAVLAMRAQRTELSNQLQSAQRRRDDIVEQLREASTSERPGLEARLRVLDDRILNVEQEIARTGQLIAQAPGELLETTTTQAPNPSGIPFRSVDTTAISMVFTLFVLAPIAFTVARLIWKRGSAPPRPQLDAESQERMRRLESAVDTVAIEVERISEGQRFITKLLAEREKQQLPR